MAWACRGENAAMNKCLSMYTDETSLDRLKVMYIEEKRRRLAAAGPAGAAGAAPPGASLPA